MGRFPGEFLRRIELIKRSLRLDDEPKWWCPEPLQVLVEQHGIPAGCNARIRVSVTRSLVGLLSSGRRESPRRSGVDIRKDTTMTSPPDLPKLDANASDMPACMSAVTPAAAAPGASAGGSGIPFTSPRPLAGLVCEKARRVLPGSDTFLFRPQDDRTELADQVQGPATPLAMADLDTALSTFRESLLADASRVIAASPAGSAQDPPRRKSPVDTRKSRSKEKERRHRSPSPSSSSTAYSPSPATAEDDDDRVGTKAGSGKLAVLEC